LLVCVAFALLGLAFLSSTGPPRDSPALYVPAPALPSAYRAAGAPAAQALRMSAAGESAEEAAKRAWLARLELPLGAGVRPDPSGQPDSSYDWRMNPKDWRFQMVSCIPFGLLFIAMSLQSTKRAESLEDEDECEIATLNGTLPPEKCRQMVAMAAVDGRMRDRVFGD